MCDIRTLEYSFPLLNRGSHAYGSNYNITAILKILNHLRKKSRFQLQSSSGGDPMSRCGKKRKQIFSPCIVLQLRMYAIKQAYKTGLIYSSF